MRYSRRPELRRFLPTLLLHHVGRVHRRRYSRHSLLPESDRKQKRTRLDTSEADKDEATGTFKYRRVSSELEQENEHANPVADEDGNG